MRLLPILLTLSLAAGQEVTMLAQPFETAYTGDDATGAHVIGLWSFDAGQELTDLSGHGHDLTLNGGEIVEQGKFGGALQSGPGWPVNDQPHQASCPNAPDLSPKGAFTWELWLCPTKEFEGYGEAIIVDKKYVDQAGYQWALSAAGGKTRRMLLRLGFGSDSENYASDGFIFETDVWHHLAFTYDGAGTVRFFIDGAPAGSEFKAGRAAVAPCKHKLVLGDRIGSYYHGFPGYLDQIRLCNGALKFSPLGVGVKSRRRVFYRMENPAALQLAVTNQSRQPMAAATAVVRQHGTAPVKLELPELSSGEEQLVDCPLDTALRPGVYPISLIVELPREGEPFVVRQSFSVTILPRPLSHTMPVVMWGANAGEVDRLREIGFTMCTGPGTDLTAVWAAGKPVPADSETDLDSTYAALDQALVKGLGVYLGLSPGRWARTKEEVQRVNAEGKPYGKRDDVCGVMPKVQQFCYDTGASAIQSYGEHPGVQASLIHTEVRGETNLCYHQWDRDNFKLATGLDIPEGLTGPRGTAPDKLKDFPASRVIADDYPPYVYYQWFWKLGDGWNLLNSAVHDGLKSTGRKDLWTFHDPACRVPSIYGSGGDVDVLSHWTYSYPDPLRIGLCTDELFCMADGADRPDQQVMKMTQVIWYRSQTAPEPGEEAKQQSAEFNDQDTKPQGTGAVDASGKYRAAWEIEQPDARFITIAPMHLREAFWTKLSRPIKGIMYHGWQSLVDLDGSSSAYRYTNPETRHELARLVRKVIEPLGPTLTQVPDHPADVAFLESFASQMFARRGTYGWNGSWAGEAFLILQYAHLQSQVVYEETVKAKGLDAYKVLVAVDCDVLPQSVVDQLQAFQQRGGIIVGDAELCPAIKPDILLERVDRPKDAAEAKQLLQDKAAALRAELDAKYQRYADTDTPEIVPRIRTFGSSDYLFLVNDHREFGDYVGQHRLVMENGLPTSGTVTLGRTGHVYDLLANREVQPATADGKLSLQVNLGPCEGRVYLVTGQAIEAVKIEAPAEALPGGQLPVRVTVVDDSGKPLDAVVPVEVRITDPSGRQAEFSGWYGAVRGQVAITAALAANDTPGLWRVHVRELASGAAADAYVRVGATP